MDVGGKRIGLRWSEPGLDAGLRALLGSALADGDAPGNISVVVGVRDAALRAKHKLYVQGRPVLLSGTDERLHRAIVRCLSDLASERPVGTVSVRAAVVVAPDGRAILVDRRLAHNLWNLDRRLRRQGCRVIDSARVNVDTTTGSVVLTHPAALVEAEAAASLLAASDDFDGLDDLRGGSIAISHVVFQGDADADDLAKSLAEAAPVAIRIDHTLRSSDVELVLELFRRVETRSVVPHDPDALMAAIDPSSR